MSGVSLVPTFTEPRKLTHALRSGRTYGFSQNVSYYNNFSTDVRLGLRNGLIVEIPSEGDMRSMREFVVIVEYVFTQEVYDRLQYSLHAPEADDNPCLTALRDNLFRDGAGKYAVCKSRIEYAITESDFIHKGKCIYIHDLDIVLGAKNRELTHPYSPKGAMYRTAVQYHDKEHCFSIEYIQEAGDNRPIFIRVAGQVLQIDPKQSEVQPAGIYFCANHARKSISGPTDNAFIRIDADNPDEMRAKGFYRTYDEAANGPDMETAQKLELTKAQVELSRKSLILEELKQNFEIERMEFKRMLAIKEAELKESQLAREQLSSAVNDRMANEQAVRKMQQAEYMDKLEERSAHRKEQTEIIKYIPSFILGIGAAFVALKSLMK